MALDGRTPGSTLEAEADLLPEHVIAMMNPYDTGLLSDFQENLQAHIERLRETGRPTVLTVDGRTELVVMSVEAYRAMLEAVDRAEAIVGILRGLEDIRRGDTLPLDEAFEEIRKGGGRPGA